jgi:hypothetical protein
MIRAASRFSGMMRAGYIVISSIDFNSLARMSIKMESRISIKAELYSSVKEAVEYTLMHNG